jgi:ethanolamine ammonia-lyase large subunit
MLSCARGSAVVTPMGYVIDLQGTRFSFPTLKDLLAKASPERSGDQLAGLAADGPVERLAAQMRLADVPLAELAHGRAGGRRR